MSGKIQGLDKIKRQPIMESSFRAINRVGRDPNAQLKGVKILRRASNVNWSSGSETTNYKCNYTKGSIRYLIDGKRVSCQKYCKKLHSLRKAGYRVKIPGECRTTLIESLIMRLVVWIKNVLESK